MKTCALYGFIISLASAFMTLILFFAGLHSDPAKMGLANGIGMAGGLVIGIGGTVLGVSARRAEYPANEDFTYGRALGAGVLISVFTNILSAIFGYVYGAFINPGFRDVVVQAQVDKMQAAGVPSAQIEQVEKVTRFFASPGIGASMQLLMGLIFGVIFSLLIAIFLKRQASPAVPPVQA